jgi:hypothetical protein
MKVWIIILLLSCLISIVFYIGFVIGFDNGFLARDKIDFQGCGFIYYNGKYVLDPTNLNINFLNLSIENNTS